MRERITKRRSRFGAVAAMTTVGVIAVAGSVVVLDREARADNSHGYTGTVSVVHINDVHGNIEASPSSLGYATISGYIDRVRSENENTVALDAGDVLAGNANAAVDGGLGFVDVLNTLGLDAMTAGNSEFVYGLAHLADFSDQLSYPMLSPNIIDDATGEAVGESNTIIELPGGITVGVFGVTTGGALSMGTSGLTYRDPVEVATAQVAELEAAGVDLVIALSHLGDIGTSGTSLELADEVPGIDLIVDGHSHTVLPTGLERNGVLIVQAGQYGAYVGTVDIEMVSGEVAGVSARLSNAENLADIVPAADTQEAVDAFLVKAEAYLDSEVGSSTVLLEGTRDVIRTRETNLGNLVTDALREQTGSEVAVMSAGFIGGPINAGPLTMRSVYTISRIETDVIVKRISGTQFIGLLEGLLKLYPESSGSFPQISGASYRIDPSAAPKVHSVTVDGEDVNPSGTYRVAMNSSLASAAGIADEPVVQNFGSAALVIADYLRENTPVSPEVEGRIAEAETPQQGEEPTPGPSETVVPTPGPSETVVPTPGPSETVVPTPEPSRTPNDDNLEPTGRSMPIWYTFAGAVTLIGLGSLLVIRRRRETLRSR